MSVKVTIFTYVLFSVLIIKVDSPVEISQKNVRLSIFSVMSGIPSFFPQLSVVQSLVTDREIHSDNLSLSLSLSLSLVQVFPQDENIFVEQDVRVGIQGK